MARLVLRWQNRNSNSAQWSSEAVKPSRGLQKTICERATRWILTQIVNSRTGSIRQNGQCGVNPLLPNNSVDCCCCDGEHSGFHSASRVSLPHCSKLKSSSSQCQSLCKHRSRSSAVSNWRWRWHMTLTLSTHITFTAYTLKPNNNRAAAKLQAESQRSITNTLLNTESKSFLSSCYKPLWCGSHAGQRQFSGRSASEWPGVQCAWGGCVGRGTSCCATVLPENSWKAADRGLGSEIKQVHWQPGPSGGLQQGHVPEVKLLQFPWKHSKMKKALRLRGFLRLTLTQLSPQKFSLNGRTDWMFGINVLSLMTVEGDK